VIRVGAGQILDYAKEHHEKGFFGGPQNGIFEPQIIHLKQQKCKSETVLFPRLYHGTFYGADLGQEKGDLRPKSTFSKLNRCNKFALNIVFTLVFKGP